MSSEHTLKIQQNKEISEPEIPKLKVVYPREPTDLRVEEFRSASYVGPETFTSEGSPIVIVLHGNYDRPEWQCSTWNRVAAFYGWILCPRGIPSPYAHISEDRWTYRGSAAVIKEIEASVQALKELYPKLIVDNERMLVGFSLGAILAHAVVTDKKGVYKYLYLVEGGAEKLTNAGILSLKQAGIKGIGMAMSTSKNRKHALDAIKRIKKQGLRTVFVDMSGAGHNYRHDFNLTGRKSTEALILDQSN